VKNSNFSYGELKVSLDTKPFGSPDLKIGATKSVMPNGIISNEKLLREKDH